MSLLQPLVLFFFFACSILPMLPPPFSRNFSHAGYRCAQKANGPAKARLTSPVTKRKKTPTLPDLTGSPKGSEPASDEDEDEDEDGPKATGAAVRSKRKDRFSFGKAGFLSPDNYANYDQRDISIRQKDWRTWDAVDY